MWQYGQLINGFAAEFSRPQLREFVEAWGVRMDSLSRDGRVSINGGGGPSPATTAAAAATVAAVTILANATSDASASVQSDPITAAVLAELRSGVQQLSSGSATSLGQLSSGVSASSMEEEAGWGLDRIDQPYLPLDGLYHYYNTGSGVNVYVVDTVRGCACWCRITTMLALGSMYMWWTRWVVVVVVWWAYGGRPVPRLLRLLPAAPPSPRSLLLRLRTV